MSTKGSFSLSVQAYCDAPVPSDKLKRTSLGKYSTATEAYEKWKANPDHVTITRCRTPEEYVLAVRSRSYGTEPSSQDPGGGKWDPEKKDVVLDDNPDFIKDRGVSTPSL